MATLSVAYKHIHSRNNEENQAVSENKRDESRASVRRKRQLPTRQTENDKVEYHGVNECDCEEAVIGRYNHTADWWNPGGA